MCAGALKYLVFLDRRNTFVGRLGPCFAFFELCAVHFDVCGRTFYLKKRRQEVKYFKALFAEVLSRQQPE